MFTAGGQLGFDLPKALWSRALEWPIAAVLLLTVYRYGRAVLPWTRLHLFVGAYVVANALALITAENLYISVFGERNRYLGMTNVIDMALLYVALVVAFRRMRDWALLAATIAAATLVAIAYGTIQYAGLDPVRWGRDPHLRPFGTLGNEDMFGHLLATMTAACVAFALAERSRRLRIAAGAVGLASVAMLALTGTRGSVLALGGALAAGGVILVVTRGGAVLRSRIFAICAAGAAIAAIALLLSPTGRRLTLTGPPLGDRLLVWQGAFNTFLARPVLGWGPDGLATGFGSVRPLGMEDIYVPGELITDQAHDWILQALATTGIVGGLALFALLGAFALALFRQRRGPHARVVWPLILASLAYWLNALSSPDSVSISWIPWVTLATIAWVAARAPTATPAVRAVPSWAVPAALVLSLGIATTGWNAYRANAEILRASVAYPRDANETIAGANAAIALDPGRGDYWNYRGLGFQLRGQFVLAAADFSVAAGRLPYQSAYWINVSRSRLFQLQNGDFSGGGANAAIAAANRAIAMEPRLSPPHRNSAEIALALGDPALALTEAATALDLYTGDPLIDAVLGKAAVQLPDRDRARRVLEGAVAKKSRSAPLWAALAQVQLAAGNPAAARLAAARALESDPASADALRVLDATTP